MGVAHDMKLKIEALVLGSLVGLLAVATGNDDFADRSVITAALPATISVPLDGATHEPAEPLPYYNEWLPDNPVPSRWWTWRATESGWLQVDARASSVQVTVAVFTGDQLDRLLQEAASSKNAQPLLQIEAVAGTEYHILVAAQDDVDGQIEFELSAVPPVASNDDFADRIDLGDALDVSFVGNNFGATAEEGEPDHFGLIPISSLWWQISPDADRGYRIDYDNGAPYYETARVAVWEGTSLGNLRQVAAGGLYGRGSLVFAAEAGKVYQLAYDRTPYLQTVGPVAMRVKAVPPLGNDAAVDGIDLGSVPTAVLDADLGFATREPNEPDHFGDSAPYRTLYNTAWYEWVAPADGHHALIADGVMYSQRFNPSAAVYRKDPFDGLVQVAFPGPRATSFIAQAGERYAFAMGTGFQNAGSPARIELKPLPLPANDDFANAIDLGVTATVAEEGHNLGATLEIGEPPSGSNSSSVTINNSVWYHWQPPIDGTYRMELADSIFYGTFNVYTGDTLSGLNLLQPLTPYYEFEAAAGTRYTIRVQGNRGDGDFFTLRINPIPATTNDDFADAIDLGQAAVVRSEATAHEATFEQGEPQASRPRTIWWRWVAPEEGVWDLYAQRETDIDVFVGTELANIQRVHQSEDVERTAFIATAGTQYFIRIAEQVGRDIVLSIRRGTQPAGDLRSEAIDLGGAARAQGRNGLIGAGAEAIEPGTRNVWWEWQAPAAGRYGVSVDGSGTVDIYRGAPDDAFLDLVPAIIAKGEQPLTQLIDAAAGDRFLILVSDRDVSIDDQSGGFVEISLAPYPTPPGDFFAEAIDLGGDARVYFEGAGANATYEPFEPSSGVRDDSGSIWMRWTAPRTERFKIEADTLAGGDEDQSVVVYSGDGEFDSLTLVGADYGDEEPAVLFFDAVAGTDYTIVFESDEHFELFGLDIRPVRLYDTWAIPGVFTAFLTEEELVRDANPSGDGVSNLLKFLLGLDPELPLAQDPARGNFPQIVPGDEFLELRYRLNDFILNSAAGGLPDHFGEVSTDAVSWARVDPEAIGDGWFAVRVPVGDGETKLLRLKVSDD